MSAQPVLIRQSTRKLFRVLPLAFGMFAASGLILAVAIYSRSLLGMLVGVIAVAFFGPALFILVSAVFWPSSLTVDDRGVRCRFYSVEIEIPWENIRDVSGRAGWPALTFHDCEAVARAARFHGFPPLGWLLQIPTKAVSLLLRQPLANIYPTSCAQLAGAFRANERTFGFHYGMPSDLLERSNQEIVELLKRRRRGGPFGRD